MKGKADPEGTMRIKDERETENLTFELLVDSKKLIMACNTFCYISFFFLEVWQLFLFFGIVKKQVFKFNLVMDFFFFT